MQAHHLLRYAPRNTRVSVALLYAIADGTAYGWYVGAAGPGIRAAFFALMDVHDALPAPVFLRSMEDDLYGAWLQEGGGHALRVHSPLSDAMALDVARLQSAFVAEWLVLDRSVPMSSEPALHYPGPTPLSSVQIQPAQLARFERTGRLWQYATPGIDFAIVRALAAHWHIDERCDPMPVAEGDRRLGMGSPPATGAPLPGSGAEPVRKQR